jgi:general stress protein YciG
LFSSEFAEEIGAKGSQQVQQSVDELAKFSKMVKLVSFVPFQDAAHALEVANDVSEGTFNFTSFTELQREAGKPGFQPAPKDPLARRKSKLAL